MGIYVKSFDYNLPLATVRYQLSVALGTVAREAGQYYADVLLGRLAESAIYARTIEDINKVRREILKEAMEILSSHRPEMGSLGTVGLDELPD